MATEMQKFWDNLKTQRDELLVQMHLAKSELKEEWDQVEKKWLAAQARLEDVLDDASETAREAQGVLKVVGEEIGAAYDRIKERMDHDK